MMNVIVAGMILMIFGAAVTYIYKEKKRGVKGIGCPSAGACHKRNCGCHSDMK